MVHALTLVSVTNICLSRIRQHAAVKLGDALATRECVTRSSTMSASIPLRLSVKAGKQVRPSSVCGAPRPRPGRCRARTSENLKEIGLLGLNPSKAQNPKKFLASRGGQSQGL